MYRHQGILHNDRGVVQTVNGPAPGTAHKASGWAHDSNGRGYIRTTGPVAYKHDGFSFTPDGSMLVNSSSAQLVSDIKSQGMRFDVTGRVYLSTLKWK